ncbi:helix-turn-helix domain-containing protein [Actinocrispum sp. NPDC049592]|uniref:helix-turn-helix domain-containing protein n=1 Tax=Actinocrispum sp. NPDC049592 TaxID=3154835 RepID=UPI0034404524
MDTLDLLLHPVRLRIVHAMSGDRTLTTSDLVTRLRDVPKTSVYRHVALLAEAGILEVVDEQRVHGAVERHYRLRRDRTAIDMEAAARMTLEDHRQGFAAAMAVLLAEFNAYLDEEGADPVADAVGYRQGIIWLNPEECMALIEEVTAAFRAHAGNGPAPGRTPRLLSAIHFPIAETPS